MEEQGTKAAAFDPVPRQPRPTPAPEAPAPKAAPLASPPAAAQPSSTPAEVTDFIPEDVDSSFGGATGDLWADDWNEESPAVGGEAPAARPAPSSEGKRAPRGANKPTAPQAAFAPKIVSSDTPQGKAFAALVELFPGKVLEVVPLRQAAEADDESGAQGATEAAFADGYDDLTGAELDNDDA